MKKYAIADLHCHPNLKSFGYSFSRLKENAYNKSHVWFYDPPTMFTKFLNATTGLTKFTQVDFTTMAKGNVRLAFVSLYPFEKGFFHNASINARVAARLANLVTGIGYNRIRHLQKHTDYYNDLCNEYSFLENSCKQFKVDQELFSWEFAKDKYNVKEILERDRCIAVIPTIEGAHVFNTGLKKYGLEVTEEDVLQNILHLKQWKYPPFFITFAHNFNNDLCGHAKSLERLGKMVDQEENLDGDFSELGLKAIQSLLSCDNGRPIYIDIKHMSLKSRLAYFNLIEAEYNNKIPVIVSHGAVTGSGLHQKHQNHSSLFCSDDINFFDEELIKIAITGGVFGLQLDGNRLTRAGNLKKSFRNILNAKSISESSYIIWRQLQHFAEVLDKENLFGWANVTIGSDFDGTINPLVGIWTAENLQTLAEHLREHANNYLKNTDRLSLPENKKISPEEIVERFVYSNAFNFLERYYV